MVFSSLVFLFYFLPAALALYFLAPRPAKNLVLFAVSLIFYAWGEPVYLLLMLFSILLNYLFGRFIDSAKRRGEGLVSARFLLIAACAVNLALLGFFKYADFLVENLNRLAGFQLASPQLPLPLGISFYTFQAMSYIIDLYRGNVKVQKNLIDFGTYVALFPQLIAGPIVRFQTIAFELTCRKESLPLFSEGALRFVCGLGKKVLLANGAGVVFEQVTSSAEGFGFSDFSSLSTLSAWIGILAFTFQIYFDFSGYSDMAIGLGKMFGFHFPENFNYPYISKSITEFWRRWHMTLSSWFREYVYIPLGGNRHGIAKQLRNIAVVWALTGIWHGASWNFLLWGVYFGLLLMLEKRYLGPLLERAPAFLCHLYAGLLVVMSWVIFSIDSLSGVAGYFSAMFGLGSGPLLDAESLYLLTGNWPFLLLLSLGATPLPAKLCRRLLPTGKWIAPALYSTAMIVLFLLVTAYLVSSSYNPFLYFRF